MVLYTSDHRNPAQLLNILSPSTFFHHINNTGTHTTVYKSVDISLNTPLRHFLPMKILGEKIIFFSLDRHLQIKSQN